MAEDKSKTVDTVALSEEDKARLFKEAKAAAALELKKELEEEFREQAKKEAYESLRPKKPDEELVSIVIDLPDGTGLLTDGRLYQHGREYLVPRTVYDDMRGRIAAAWRTERELNNPFSGSKWYKKPFMNEPTRIGGDAHRY